MNDAQLLAIFVTPEPAVPVASVPQIRAIPGKGLEGDRYANGIGTFSSYPGNGREVTLVEIEALEAYTQEYGEPLPPSDARRNLLTKGVRLNDLVDREFTVGSVRLVGRRLCEPCTHLARLVGPKTLPGLVHRGGLRADILSGGTLTVGDAITV